MDKEIEDRLAKLEQKLQQVLEAVNEIENGLNTDKEHGTWYWKLGYIDKDLNWVRGRFI